MRRSYKAETRKDSFGMRKQARVSELSGGRPGGGVPVPRQVRKRQVT